jgi:hypothetical protein
LQPFYDYLLLIYRHVLYNVRNDFVYSGLIVYTFEANINTWVISEVLHTVCFLFKNEFMLQNTCIGLQRVSDHTPPSSPEVVNGLNLNIRLTSVLT